MGGQVGFSHALALLPRFRPPDRTGGGAPADPPAEATFGRAGAMCNARVRNRTATSANGWGLCLVIFFSKCPENPWSA